MQYHFESGLIPKPKQDTIIKACNVKEYTCINLADLVWIICIILGFCFKLKLSAMALNYPSGRKVVQIFTEN